MRRITVQVHFGKCWLLDFEVYNSLAFDGQKRLKKTKNISENLMTEIFHTQIKILAIITEDKMQKWWISHFGTKPFLTILSPMNLF